MGADGVSGETIFTEACKNSACAATNRQMTSLPHHPELFQRWIEEHRGIMVKVMRSFTSEPADAADLQQEMLLQLWLSLPNYAGQAKPSTWIYRVCLNTALTWQDSQAVSRCLPSSSKPVVR